MEQEARQGGLSEARGQGPSRCSRRAELPSGAGVRAAESPPPPEDPETDIPLNVPTSSREGSV